MNRLSSQAMASNDFQEEHSLCIVYVYDGGASESMKHIGIYH